MQTRCCLLLAFGLLVAALAMGNPFLPGNHGADASSAARPASPQRAVWVMADGHRWWANPLGGVGQPPLVLTDPVTADLAMHLRVRTPR